MPSAYRRGVSQVAKSTNMRKEKKKPKQKPKPKT
jgi:hypothetical protein